MNRDTFSNYNPIINFVFYIGAIAFSVFFVHPAFVVCSSGLAAAYYLSISGTRGLRLVLGMVPVLILLAVLNPLVSTSGQTVLFTWLGGRPYTLEALLYGTALGAMFVAVIIWFASYNTVMTSDKFIYIFGRMIPSMSLILTMILRLVPDYQRKTSQIRGARKSIGKGADAGSLMEKAEDGMTIISALTTWALEGGIVTADSMRSRGYGSGKRTSFSIYSFGLRDKVLLTVLIVLAVLIVVAAMNGGMEAKFVPYLEITWSGSKWTAAGMAAYFIFLSIPTVLNIAEGIVWRILRSRI